MVPRVDVISLMHAGLAPAAMRAGVRGRGPSLVAALHLPCCVQCCCWVVGCWGSGSSGPPRQLPRRALVRHPARTTHISVVAARRQQAQSANRAALSSAGRARQCQAGALRAAGPRGSHGEMEVVPVLSVEDISAFAFAADHVAMGDAPPLLIRHCAELHASSAMRWTLEDLCQRLGANQVNVRKIADAAEYREGRRYSNVQMTFEAYCRRIIDDLPEARGFYLAIQVRQPASPSALRLWLQLSPRPRALRLQLAPDNLSLTPAAPRRRTPRVSFLSWSLRCRTLSRSWERSTAGPSCGSQHTATTSSPTS